MAASKKKKNIKKKKAVQKKTVKAVRRIAKKVKKATKKVVKKRAVIKKLITQKNVSKIKKAKKIVPKKGVPRLHLSRSKKNPIIEPEEKLYWESKASFNPSAIYHDGKVHVIYRAIGDSDISVMGYAESKDGLFFNKDSKKLAYFSKSRQVTKRDPAVKIVNYSSGGGWGGGCEDPRLTLIGDRVYMIYTAFDGWGSLRLALTSISLDDFVAHRFHWKEPVLISPPNEINKNWVLFPEKIKGKYAIMHSFAPKILIDYFDNLNELDGKKFIKSNNTRPVDKTRTWDSWFRGVGPSPIKTEHGWLVIYHAMDYKNPDRYRIGAMILDLKDPTKVIYRSKEPILEPEEWYENEGYKRGVIYSCGAIVKDGKLFVYYGGADKVSCVATADLDKFLQELIHHKVPKLKTKK